MNRESFYELKALTVGAEVLHLQAKDFNNPELAKFLYADWLSHGLLIFRDLALNNAEHLALSRCFGELEEHPLPQIRSKEEPLLIELGGKAPDKAFVYDGDKLLVGRVAWHRDTAYTVDIAKGAMLRIVEFPEEDGETDFVDTALAYDGLTESLRKRIEGLEFKATLRLDPETMTLGKTWNTIRKATEEECPGSQRAVPLDVLSQYPSVVHPMVITHPESGRKCIYISPTYLDKILGVSEVESETLLREIVEHTLNAKFQYRHAWRPNDLVLWDNRRMMHAATGYKPQYRRRGLRTTLSGSLKSGRLFDDKAIAKSAALVD